jgi:hypothetical protein
MRCKRSLLLAGTGLALGLALSGGLVACGGPDPADEGPPAPLFPVPPVPPVPPAPPTPPVPSGELATDYFEVPDDGAERLEAELELSLGHVETAHAEAGYLFQAEVGLPQGRLRPRFTVRRRHGGTARVALTLDEAELSPGGVRRGGDARWRIYLPTRTPTDLALKLGASQATLDLTGVPLSNLRLDCGLSRATLRFGAPNPIEMEELVVEAGLAEFRAEGLGNARFRELRFDGGAGRFALDFTGAALLEGAEAEIDVGIAELTLTLPAGQPIVLDVPDAPFVSLDLPRTFVRDGGEWRSPEADGADDPFHFRIDAGPGRVVVRLAGQRRPAE